MPDLFASMVSTVFTLRCSCLERSPFVMAIHNYLHHTSTHGPKITNTNRDAPIARTQLNVPIAAVNNRQLLVVMSGVDTVALMTTSNCWLVIRSGCSLSRP